MSQKLSMRELDLKGKKVLMRVDFNVPFDGNGQISDDARIVASLPSISYALEKDASLILMSHLGRPKGKTASCSLLPCAKRLSQLLHREVFFVPDCIGPEAVAQVKQLKSGDLLLLENLRYYSAEEHPEKDPFFAEKLSRFGDLYVNDAFATAHRSHSSTATIAQFFPGKAAMGFLMEKEIAFLGSVLSRPERPFYALIGGAKISTKMGVLQSLFKVADALFIGGGMTYSFMKAQGIPIGDSICEEESVVAAQTLLREVQQKGLSLYLPSDIAIARKLEEDAVSQIIPYTQGIPDGFQGVDIGPETINSFADAFKRGKTFFWNGPLGVFECPPFAKGTNAIARALALLSPSATTIVGGGDSLAAIHKLGLDTQFAHLSTGGGASLEYIEFGTLPGIEALSDAFK